LTCPVHLMHGMGMTLSEFLETTNSTDAAFAAAVGVERTTVLRWRLGTTIPDRDSMAAIIRETEGRVTPNDFFGVPSPTDTEAA